MIRPVDVAPAPVAGPPRDLAAVGCAALGADAVLVCELPGAGAPRSLWSSGLSAAEEGSILAGLTHRPAQTAGAMAGFPVVLVRDAAIPGGGMVRLCALQRRRVAFEVPALASVVARHAAVAVGRRRGRPGDAGPVTSSDAYRLLHSADDWAALDRAVTELACAVVPVRRTGLLVWSPEDQELRPVPGAFGLGPTVTLAPQPQQDWAGSAARVLATGQPYVANDVAEDVEEGYAEAFAVHRLVAVPVQVGGRRVAVLQAVDKAEPFTAADIEWLTGVGAAAACAAEALQLRERVTRTERLETLFTSTAVAIASGQPLHEQLDDRLDELRGALAGTVIGLVPRDGDPIVRRAQPAQAPLEPSFLAQARGAAGYRAFDAPGRGAGQPGWGATHVPVIVDGRAEATLSLLRVGSGPAVAIERDALARMAQLIALAWATEGYQRGLADAARRAERRRISDELHDQVAQLLFAARLSLDAAAEAEPEPGGAGTSVAPRARDLLVRAEEATRAIMDRNAGPEETRVSELLARVISEVEEEYGRAVGLEVSPASEDAAAELTPVVRRLLARAAREAIVNAAKHAGPCQINVRLALTRRRRLLLTVTDAGVGVGPRRADGYGTAALRRAIRRHGGTLRVGAASATGGTRVTASLPV